jgi:uncharacterized membrane protein SirB2
MSILVNGLLWLHFVALTMGVGCGIALSQIGPRLVAAAPAERETLWPLVKTISAIAMAGLVLLLVSGPLMLWLKFDGGRGLGVWFIVKMALVAVIVVALGVVERAKAQLRRGDESAGRVINITGPVIGLLSVAIIATAVLTFH